MFQPIMAIVRFLQRLRRVYISVCVFNCLMIFTFTIKKTWQRYVTFGKLLNYCKIGSPQWKCGTGGCLAVLLTNRNTTQFWMIALMSRSVVAEQRDPLTIQMDAGWAPEGCWIFWREDKYFASAGNWTKIPE